MKYTIITDSSCNLFAGDFNDGNIDFHVAPIILILDDKEYADTDALDVQEFVTAMCASKSVKSACPSPQSYLDKMEGGDNIIVLPTSSKLSGSYQSAVIASEMFKEKYPERNIYVADSLSAACGIDYILLQLRDIIESGEKDFDGTVERLCGIISKTRVKFLLQDLNNLMKNGRLGKVTGKILTLANIKLICGDDGNGEIKKYGMSLGTRRGLKSMAEMPGKEIDDKNSLIIVNHVNNERDATFLQNILESKFGFKNVVVREMRATASMYAASKGLSMAY